MNKETAALARLKSRSIIFIYFKHAKPNWGWMKRSRTEEKRGGKREGGGKRNIKVEDGKDEEEELRS